MAQPPALSIVLLAALAVLGGMLAFSVGLVGAVLVGAGDVGLLALAVLLAAVGMLFVLAGVGLWRLDPWAWWLALGLCAFSLAAIAVDWYAWTSGVIPTAVLVVLFTVKDEFGIGGRRARSRAKPRGKAASHRQKRRAP